MTPSTVLALRIGKLFNRRDTTPWSEKEIRVYKRLVKDGCFTSVDDLFLVERYYAFQRRKGPSGIHRRDLYTFLNNYSGEVDRARAWQASMKRPVAKRYVETNGERPCTDEEFERIGQLAKAELDRFKAALGRVPQ